jgi:hypothetical protein
MRILDLRGSFTTRLGLLAVTLVTVVAVAMTSTPPAQADDGAKLKNSTHGTTTTEQRSPASDVYFVPTSYVDKMKQKCRSTFRHSRHKRHTCLGDQDARATAGRFLRTHGRVQDFWNKHVRYGHLSTWCKHHHKRCVKRFPHLYCGPLSGTGATYIAACLRQRSRDYYGRWLNLRFYHSHTVPAATTATLRLAAATIGPQDNSHFSVNHGWSWLGGPWTAIVFNRSSTEQAYQGAFASDGAIAAGSSICTAGGAALSAGLAIPPCIGMVAATIGKVRSDLTTAHNEGKCLQLRFYAADLLLPIVPGQFFPTSAVTCATGKTVRINKRSK